MHQHKVCEQRDDSTEEQEMDYTSLVSANFLIKGLFLLGDKNKQSQALPLKEDFRQVPDQITCQVFQTTWRRDVILFSM